MDTETDTQQSIGQLCLILDEQTPVQIRQQIIQTDSNENLSMKAKIEKLLGNFSPYIKQCSKKQFNGDRGKLQGFFKFIQKISFPNLKLLNLRNTSIVSIEGIERTYFPVLEELNIEDNNLTNIESLKKTNLNSLKNISYTNVLCLFADFSSKMNLTKPMQNYHIDCLPDPTTIQNICFLAKIQAPLIETVRIMSQSRINQEKVHKVLKRKWGNVDIRIGNRNRN